MRAVVSGLIAVLILLLPSLAIAQGQQNFQVAKTDKSESFVLPFTAANHNEQDPLTYTFDEPTQPSWMMSILNNISYVPREGARTIIKIQEAPPSQKFIELALYGDQSKRYWVAVNTPEAGYARIYDSENGWSTEQPISVSHTDNAGLTVTNGQRTVVDRLDVGGFVVSSVAVYGNDKNSTLANAYAGDIAFETLYGRIEQSPLYYMPAAVMIGIGGLIISLLIFKKRKPSD
ncbi:MAG: hypothetical protein ACJ707_09645 [Nitrososphaera sp.]